MGDCCSRKDNMPTQQEEMEHLKHRGTQNNDEFYEFAKLEKVYETKIQNLKTLEKMKKTKKMIIRLIGHCKYMKKNSNGEKGRIFLEVSRAKSIPLRGMTCCCGVCDTRDCCCGCCANEDARAFVNVRFKEKFNENSEKTERIFPEWKYLFRIKEITDQESDQEIEITFKLYPDYEVSKWQLQIKNYIDEEVHLLREENWIGRIQLIKNPELYWTIRLKNFEKMLMLLEQKINDLIRVQQQSQYKQRDSQSDEEENDQEDEEDEKQENFEFQQQEIFVETKVVEKSQQLNQFQPQTSSQTTAKNQIFMETEFQQIENDQQSEHEQKKSSSEENLGEYQKQESEELASEVESSEQEDKKDVLGFDISRQKLLRNHGFNKQVTREF